MLVGLQLGYSQTLAYPARNGIPQCMLCIKKNGNVGEDILVLLDMFVAMTFGKKEKIFCYTFKALPTARTTRQEIP